MKSYTVGLRIVTYTHRLHILSVKLHSFSFLTSNDLQESFKFTKTLHELLDNFTNKLFVVLSESFSVSIEAHAVQCCVCRRSTQHPLSERYGLALDRRVCCMATCESVFLRQGVSGRSNFYVDFLIFIWKFIVIASVLNCSRLPRFNFEHLVASQQVRTHAYTQTDRQTDLPLTVFWASEDSSATPRTSSSDQSVCSQPLRQPQSNVVRRGRNTPANQLVRRPASVIGTRPDTLIFTAVY